MLLHTATKTRLEGRRLSGEVFIAPRRAGPAGDARVYSHVVPGAVLVHLDSEEALAHERRVRHRGVYELEVPEDLVQ